MSQWIPEKLPEDTDAEAALLSTVCSPGADRAAGEVAAFLNDGDFVHPKHKIIFAAMVALSNRQEEINALTLKAEIEAKGNLGRVGGYSALVELLQGEEVGRPMALAMILRKHRKHRELIKLGAQMVRDASAEEEEPETLAQATMETLADLATSSRGGGLVTFQDLTAKVEASAEQKRAAGKVRGIRCGMDRLDGMTRGGLRPGMLVVVAARPGVGKTSLALQWAIKGAVSQSQPVGFFSLEMDGEEVWQRALSCAAGVPVEAIESGHMTAEQSESLIRADRELNASRLMIDDQATLTVADIRARVDRATVKVGQCLGLVVVDYLQLISSPKGASKQNENARIAEISRALKLLAKDRHVPVIILSQLNREVEKRTNGRPQLSDLRDSGAIEQDADMVIFIHRKGEDPMGELIIAKHRGGKTGTIPVRWDGDVTTFREVERSTSSVGFGKPAPMVTGWEE